MPYYNIVDGHCFVILEQDLTKGGLHDNKSNIEKDINFQALANEIKSEGLTISVKVDQDFGWLTVYFGKLINNDNHSYQGKIITFDKTPINSPTDEEKMKFYDIRIAEILDNHQLPFKKDVGIIYNQWG